MNVVGIDVGGTKVASAPLRGGRLLGESLVRPTERSSSEALIDQLFAMVVDQGVEELEGVGIGVPSVVDCASGRVVSSVNIPLTDVPLGDVLSERLEVPVFVDNDATVAALAEAHDENLRLVAQNLVMLTVGTGIGGGIVLGGHVYRGATGGAGEVGHTIVGLDLSGEVPPAAGFPQPGSLEFEASGHALDRLATEAAAGSPESALGRLRAAGQPVLGAEAVSAARAGDPVAARIVEIWGERLGIGIANMINIFDPEEVVIGGGAAAAGELLLEPARRVALTYVLAGLGRKTRIRLAWHGVRAGVLGAALVALHELSARGEVAAAAAAGAAGRAGASQVRAVRRGVE